MLGDGFAFLETPLLWGVLSWRLLAASFIIFLGFLSRRIIIWLFKLFAARVAKNSRYVWDNDFVELVPTPLSLAVQLGLWQVAVKFLDLPTEPFEFESIIDKGLGIALAFAACWLMFRLIDVVARALARAAALTESRLDDQIVPMIRKSAKVVVGLTFGIMVVQNLGYSVTSLIASLGVGGLAMALAAKDTVANLFGSVVVFTDQPFQIGDWVKFDGIEGTVEEVGFRTTRIRQFDKAEVTVPNQTFSTSPITNFSRRPIRRIKFNLDIAQVPSAEAAKALLTDFRDILKGHSGLDQSFHFAHLVSLESGHLVVQIYCFTKSTIWLTYLRAQEELLFALMDAIQARGMRLAYPGRQLLMEALKHEPELDAETEAPGLPVPPA